MTEVSAKRALRLLATGPMEILGLLRGASNHAFLARIVEDGLTTMAVYKPRDGETPLWDFPGGTLYRREAAAYLVSEALGWGIVPPTVVRTGPLGVGSVQLFVDSEPGEHYLTLGADRAGVFRTIAAFDVAVNNADRKSGSCLLERSTGRIFAVDHGVCFHAEPKLRTVIWDFAAQAVPGDLLADLADLTAQMDRDSAISHALGMLLAGEEVAAFRRRVAGLLERRVFPEPGPGRPYPWPPV